MTVNVFAIAKNGRAEDDGMTIGQKYPVLKITYPKLFNEGLITTINDKGQLIRVSAYCFNFCTEQK